MRLLLFCALILICLIGCNKGEDEKTGCLTGIVIDEFDKPIEGAEVLITSPSYTRYSKTNNLGQYYFMNSPVSTYTLDLKKESYISLSEIVTLVQNDTVKKDFVLKVGIPILTISDSIISCSSGVSVFTCNILSNTSWVITNTCNWISTNIQSGNRDNLLRISIAQNEGNTVRNGTIVINAGGLFRTIRITQDFGLNLLAYTGSDGKADLSDTVFVLFNRKVKALGVRMISNGLSFYRDEGAIRSFSNSNGFKFQCTGKLTREDTFEYAVVDMKNGETCTGTFKVVHFTKRIDLKGKINDCYISPDNNEIWLALQENDELVKVSLTNLEIEKKYSLSFPPLRIRFNPYNSRFYIIPGRYNYYPPDPNLYVFDFTQERVIKTMSFQPHPDDHPQYPAIYPGDVMFTNSGFGIILFSSNGSSGGNYDAIDSSQGDSIYHPTNWSLETNTGHSLYSNFDYSKIYLTETACVLKVIDGNSREMSILKPPIDEWQRFGGLSVNQKTNKIYLSQYNKQYIYNPDNLEVDGILSYFCPGPTGNFSYRQGDDNIIYALDYWDDYFYVLDYRNARTLRTIPIYNDGNYYSKVLTTTDGKYMIIPLKNRLYVFDTELF
ncbi:MAG: carboxypeptidase regulatory-like domain-containing protein [Bacteroidales bacterium]